MMEDKPNKPDLPEKETSSGSRKSSWGKQSGTGTPGTNVGSGTKWQDSGTGSAREETDGDGPEQSRRIRRVEKLGAGSFGEVWLVEYLGALEAHKTLGPNSRKDAFREAVNTRSVNHPNVVKVMDVIDDGDVSALRMEYVEGKDLQRQIGTEGIIPEALLLPLAIQVADALQATHERGIVHLDLKPSNLILRKDGKSLVVTDFGISAALRLRDGELRGGRGGTPYFMAPELHEKGGTGSPQSDIWSLGVTLYYLLSGTYPFPFAEMAPAAAVANAPGELPESHPYVSAAFWALIKKMLCAAPTDRPESMAAVKLDLEEIAGSLTCPDCAQVFRFTSIAGVCPNPDCQSPNVVPLKSGLLLKTAAGTALAECNFKEAESKGKKALAEFAKLTTKTGIVGEMESFLQAVPGLGKDHGDSITSCRELIQEEKYIEGIHRVEAALLRFSRSSEIMALRLQLREKFVELYANAADTVRAKIRNREFESARADLSRIDHLLGDKIAGRELQLGLAEELRDLGWLHEEINRQQKAFQHNQEMGKEALGAFDFTLAMEAYTFLESNFPSEEGRNLLSSLGRASGLFSKQERFTIDFLRELIADPTKANGLEDLSFQESTAACAKLVEAFPPSRFPAFGQIQEKVELFRQASDGLREFVEQSLKQAETSRNNKNLLEENLVLEMIKGIVQKSDLFDTRARAFVQDRLRATTQGVAEAERLYREGKLGLESREFPKALASFREALRIAPGTYEDLETLITEVETRQEEFRSCKSRHLEYQGRIERGDFDLAFAIESLEMAERLFQVADDQERQRWFSEVATGFLRLLDAQREYLENLPDSGGGRGSELASFFFDNLIPMLEVLPDQRWNDLVTQSRELRRTICELFIAVGPRPKMAYEELAKLVNPLLNVMSSDKLGRILCLCMPPQGATHPSLKWGELLLDAFRRGSLGTRNQHATAADEILGKLISFCPAEIKPKLDRVLADLRRRSRQATLVSQLHHGREVAIKYRYAAGVVFLTALVFFFIGKSSGHRSAFSWVPGAVSHIGLKDLEQADALAGLIDQAEEPAEIVARIALLQGWASLKKSLTEKSTTEENNKRLTAILQGAMESHVTLGDLIKANAGGSSGAILTKLQESLLADVEEGVLVLVGNTLRKAATNIATGHPEEDSYLPILRSKFMALLDIIPIRRIKLLNQRLDGFMAILGADILSPLREKRWDDFNPEAIFGGMSLQELDLQHQIREDLGRVMQLELRRALVLGLKDSVDAILLGGTHTGYPEMLARIGRTISRLPGLGVIDEKHAKGTLKLVLEWVNKCFTS